MGSDGDVTKKRISLENFASGSNIAKQGEESVSPPPVVPPVPAEEPSASPPPTTIGNTLKALRDSGVLLEQTLPDDSAIGQLHSEMARDFDVASYRTKILAMESQNQFKPMSACKILTETNFEDKLDRSQPTYRVYKPANLRSQHTIFYIPGTAFVVHETSFTDVFCTHMAYLCGVKIIALYHRLSPEYKGDTLLKDCENLINAILAKQRAFQVNRYDMGIMGYSTGAYFAARLVQKACFDFKYQVLLSPFLDLSLTKYANRPNDKIVRENLLHWCAGLFEPDLTKRASKGVSPVFLPLNELKRPSQSVIVSGESDITRPDAVDYASMLNAVPGPHSVSQVVFGTDHGFLWRELGNILLLGDYLRMILKPLAVIEPTLIDSVARMRLLDQAQESSFKTTADESVVEVIDELASFKTSLKFD